MREAMMIDGGGEHKVKYRAKNKELDDSSENEMR